ncbi:MAG: hypothetical protein HOB69_06400 [Flavobacterium sp.]|jgi:hypothetical protein|nr:hypothetical protein [Flavobacterium sp.]
MVAPAIVAGAARGVAFARPVVMGSMKKTMQSTARGGARAGSKSAVRGSAGTGTAMKQMLNASMIQDSMSLLETVEQVSGSKPVESKKVLGEIRDGIIKLGTIFTNKISGLNSHLAFRLDKLNTTMTTIGKVLAADLDLEKKSFDDANKDQIEEDRKKSLGGEDEKKNKPKNIFSKMFDGIKGAFNSIIDFFTPKSDLAKVGLAGLAVLAVFAFRDKIEETFTKVFAYLDTLKEAFKEGGFKGLGNKIQEDIKKNIINPTLSSVGLRVKEDGTIGLVQGSFLDKVNPFGGPTNIFKTLNAFRTGINPYDNNSKMYPEWYYKGFMENLNDLLTPEDPDMLVNAIKNTMNAITKGISEFFTDTEISTPDGTYTQKSGMSEMKDQMMENFRNNVKGIKEFFHDEDGNLFGIDFKALKDLLPTIQEIAESIYNALPQWARPDTLAEKNVDRDIERLRDIDFFDKDTIGKSEIDRSKIDQASPEELKSLLSKESDDLRSADIKFIENKIIEKERLLEKTSTTDLSSFTTTETSKLKTESLKKLVEEKSAINNTPPGNITVMTDAKKVSTNYNSSKTDVIASDFRTDSMELSAQEQMNFFRTNR